jgi:hypothetical protein
MLHALVTKDPGPVLSYMTKDSADAGAAAKTHASARKQTAEMPTFNFMLKPLFKFWG